MAGPNTDFQGRSYESGPPMRVSGTKIREFAKATGNTHSYHLDAGAAQAAGYRDILAPVTFLVTLAQAEEARYINDPAAGIDFSRVVHAQEQFQLERPVIAGDELVPTLHVESIASLGAHAMVSTRVDFHCASEGTKVATVTSSLIIRAQEDA